MRQILALILATLVWADSANAAFNGSGTFVRVHDWTEDRDNGVNINADRMDEEFDGMATGLSTCVTKDGQTTITGNLPMSGFRHTGVGNASARNDYAAAGQIQDQSFIWAGTAGGTANALTLTPSPAITAYATGQSFVFKAGSSANSAATTVAISGLSTIAVQYNGAACIGGEIQANKWYRITLDSASTAQLEAISTQLPFIDSIAVIRGSSDNTKQSRFEVDGHTTANTRVHTLPNRDGTLADDTDLALKAPLASPTFTGTPVAPTASADTNTTQLATTAFVLGQAATQANQETATSTTTYVSPGRQQYHPSAAKAWVTFNGTGSNGAVTPGASYNITSVTKNGTGDYTVTIATDFSGAEYACSGIATNTTDGLILNLQDGALPSAGVVNVITQNRSGASTNAQRVMLVCFGDQ